VLPSEESLSTKAIPAPAPIYGVIVEPGAKSYSRLARMPSWPTWLLIAAGGEAGLRSHAVAEDGGVEQPVHAAFRTDVEAGRRSLRLRRDRQHRQSSGGQQCLLHK